MADKIEICASSSLAMLHEQLATLVAQQKAEGWQVKCATTSVAERSYKQYTRPQLFYTTTVLFTKKKK